jgi:hypothetical protein
VKGEAHGVQVDKTELNADHAAVNNFNDTIDDKQVFGINSVSTVALITR